MNAIESNYNLIDWWKKVFLNNYANFSGRARRAEFWYYWLCNIIIIFALGLTSSLGVASSGLAIFSLFGFILMGFYLSLIIPTLAVTVRRLHDTNKSGWYYFISLIPLIGGIILLVWLLSDGDRYTNNYGEDPKNPAMPSFDFENNG